MVGIRYAFHYLISIKSISRQGMWIFAESELAAVLNNLSGTGAVMIDFEE